MKARRIILGVSLLALAGGIIGTKAGFIPTIPISTIILGGICGVLIIDGIRHRNFFLMLIPMAIIVHRLVNYWGIFSSFRLFEAIGVAALAAAGLTAILGNKMKTIGKNRDHKYINNWTPFGEKGGTGTEVDMNRFPQQPGFSEGNAGGAASEYGRPNDDGDDVVISNGFGKLTRYLHSENLKRVKIDNGFGNCIVYYDNVIMDQDGSRLEISNGFGQVDVYIPPFFRFRMKQDNGFGSINLFGSCSMDPSAPLIDADINNGMGKVNIYFG